MQTSTTTETNSFDYAAIRAIDVSAYIEKKNNLSYLSWAHAIDLITQLDPNADWKHVDTQSFGATLMVITEVSAFGRTRRMQLPVMDYKNKAIASPDAFAVNTAIMRCVAKNISINFGLGQSIYVGEDIPTPALNAVDCSTGEIIEPKKVETVKAVEATPKPVVATHIQDAEALVLSRIDVLASKGAIADPIGFNKFLETFDLESQARLRQVAISKGVLIAESQVTH